MNYKYNSSRNIIDIICLQETWSTEKNDSFLDIPGYFCVSKYATCGEKGGLATYIADHLKFDIVDTLSHSENVWENLFIRVHVNNKFSVIIGNIYRPPRDRPELLTNFKSELSSILQSLDRSEQLYVAGDYNLDLLRCASSDSINDFFDMMCSLGFFPKILLPTRITPRSMTLIDNFFCKHSGIFCDLQAGILTHKLSDHQPYFLSISIPGGGATERPVVAPVHKRPLNKSESLKFKQILSEGLPKLQFSHNLEECPNNNYNTLSTFLSDTYESSLSPDRPSSKRRQPRSSWITKGLLRSINTRDKLCKKISKCKDERKREHLQLQLKNFRKNLRRTCNLAKTNYYKNIFENSKHDLRKTWTVINSLINNTKSKKDTLPDSFLVEGDIIKEPKIIANKLNDFFVQIAEKLTRNLPCSNNITFENFLNDPLNVNLNLKMLMNSKWVKSLIH